MTQQKIRKMLKNLRQKQARKVRYTRVKTLKGSAMFGFSADELPNKKIHCLENRCAVLCK